MKNNPNAIYTLTLDYARVGEPERKTRWVKLTHREAMRKVRRAKELGDGGIDPYATEYPLQRWQIDSGWQDPSLLTSASK